MKPTEIIPGATLRPRVAVAGTSSFIGAAVCSALSSRFEVVVLTRSMVRAMSGGNEGVEVRTCDHFARRELAVALRGVDYAVYLVRNWDPSALLDQARSRDMDLLMADNFAWAAERAGVKQILCRVPLVTSRHRFTSCHASEMEEVLNSHGVPVTVLRTSLVLGPGGELSKLLANMVRRLPAIPLPSLAETQVRPVHLEGFLTAVQHCVGNPQTFSKAFDIFGPEPISFRWMLKETARILGRHPRLVSCPGMPSELFRVMLRLLQPSLHPDFLGYLLDMFSDDTSGMENPVEKQVAQTWKPLREVLGTSVRAACEGLTTPPLQRVLDDEVIRQMQRVRSIQRLRLPEGRNAEWLADHYFIWLGNLLRPFIRTKRDRDGSWTVDLKPFGITLLYLTFRPDHSSPNRRMFMITSGVLARYLGGRKARMEFRDLLNGRYSLVAIHDFAPSLSWSFYRFTQAVVHGLVMKGFQVHMKDLAGAEPLS